MKYFLSIVLLLVLRDSFSTGSQIISPGLTPVIPRNVVPLTNGVVAPGLPAPGLAYGFPPAFIPNLTPAIAPFLPRNAFPVAPAVAAPLQPFPGAVLPTGYSTGYAVPSPVLPPPFAPQARSIHAVAVAPALPPLSLAR